LVTAKNFKSKAQKQIADLESNSKNFIKLDYFRSQFESYESRIRDYIDKQFNDVNE